MSATPKPIPLSEKDPPDFEEHVLTNVPSRLYTISPPVRTLPAKRRFEERSLRMDLDSGECAADFNFKSGKQQPGRIDS